MRKDGHADGDGNTPEFTPRRTPEDHEGLGRLLDAAGELLRAGDPRRADEALKRAGVKAAAMWGGVGVPVLPGPVRDLISLAAEAQDLASHADGSADTAPLLMRLDELRSIFERQAAREAGASPAENPR